jgi:hypothetical protein
VVVAIGGLDDAAVDQPGQDRGAQLLGLLVAGLQVNDPLEVFAHAVASSSSMAAITPALSGAMPPILTAAHDSRLHSSTRISPRMNFHTAGLVPEIHGVEQTHVGPRHSLQHAAVAVWGGRLLRHPPLMLLTGWREAVR